MDDVKNQFKGLVKKFNNPFASSSSRFKGEGHRLGNDQNSSQQKPNSQQHPPPQQQGDWRKLQQDRWERERSPHPTPRQDRSQPSIASPAQSQPFKSSISNGSTAHVPSSSLNASGTQPNSGSYEINISDALQDHAHISDAAILQNDHGSDPRLQGSQDLDAQKFDNMLLSSSDGVNPSKDEELDAQNNNDVPISNFNEGSGQSGLTPMFDPFSSQIGSIASSTNSKGLQMFQCPVCGSWWKSETEVNDHVDDCLTQNASIPPEDTSHTATKSLEDQTKVALGVFLSGGPSSETMDVFVRILRNILNSPDLEKFRKIRLSNPKIHDTVGMALGGVELLEAVGFDYQTEGDEIWAVMGLPSVDQVKAMEAVIAELEVGIRGPPKEEPRLKQKPSGQRKVDRQVSILVSVTK